MDIKTTMRKIGGSFHFLVDKAIVNIFNLEKDNDDYEWVVKAYNNGNTISFKRIKKETAQEIIDNINTEIKNED